MKKPRLSAWIKPLAATAAGVLLYALVAKLPLPLLLGQTVRLQYAVLGFSAVAFGPVVGLCVGTLGELLLAAQSGGLWWSVVIATTLVGFWTGALCGRKDIRYHGFGIRKAFGYFFACFVSHAAAFVVVCPVLDMLFYREAATNIFWRGAVTAAGNALVAAFVGTALLAVYAAVVYRPGKWAMQG